MPAVGMNLIEVAQKGFANNASAYDQTRPGYTEQTLNFILHELLHPADPQHTEQLRYDVLELGAGTGKFTEGLVPKLPSGYRYMATEPSSNFLDLLKAKVETKSLPVETSNMAASAIPLPDKCVQNIICAQCLHWFSDEHSLAEMHRVLVPGGRLIGVWNVNVYEEGKWTMEVYKQRLQVFRRAGSNTVYWVNSMEWKKAFDDSPLFSSLHHKSLPGFHVQDTLDRVLSNLRTISCYNALPADQCQEFLDVLKGAILKYPDVDPDDLIVPYSSEIFVFKANE